MRSIGPGTWTDTGRKLASGESIYQKANGSYAIERGHRYLVAPTEEQARELRACDVELYQEQLEGRTNNAQQKV